MSNDLISRSKAIFFISDVLDRFGVDVGDRMANALIESLESQPTAYDADKVTEQLEEQANQYHERANQYALKGMDRQVEHMAGKACSYEHSIEIVKAGGVSDNH